MQSSRHSFDTDRPDRNPNTFDRFYQQPPDNMLFHTMPIGGSAFRPDMEFGAVSAPIRFQGRDPYLNSSSPVLQHSPSPSRFSPHLTEVPIKRMDRQSPVTSRPCESPDSVVYNIPIQVEGRDDGPAAPQRQFPPDRRPQSPRTHQPENQTPASFGHAIGGRQVRPGVTASRLRSATPEMATDDASPVRTTVPVHMDTSKPRDRSCSPAPAPKKKKTPQEQIEEANARLAELREEVGKFSGSSSDKHYRYLDEMLTRLLISLDNVETEGNEQLRLARKETVKSIQQCADILEGKGKCENQQPAERDAQLGQQAPQSNATLPESENGLQEPAPADERMEAEGSVPGGGTAAAASDKDSEVAAEVSETGSSESHL